MKYLVTYISKEIYEIEANSEEEAIDMGYELLNDDPFCFETVEEVEIKEIK